MQIPVFCSRCCRTYHWNAPHSLLQQAPWSIPVTFSNLQHLSLLTNKVIKLLRRQQISLPPPAEISYNKISLFSSLLYKDLKQMMSALKISWGFYTVWHLPVNMKKDYTQVRVICSKQFFKIRTYWLLTAICLLHVSLAFSNLLTKSALWALIKSRR